MHYDIIHNRAMHRFEISIDHYLCVIDYELLGARLSLTHVGVAKPLEGRGIAGQLTKAALDWARAESFHVIPVCPYVQMWLNRHPDYQDLT